MIRTSCRQNLQIVFFITYHIDLYLLVKTYYMLTLFCLQLNAILVCYNNLQQQIMKSNFDFKNMFFCYSLLVFCCSRNLQQFVPKTHAVTLSPFFADQGSILPTSQNNQNPTNQLEQNISSQNSIINNLNSQISASDSILEQKQANVKKQNYIAENGSLNNFLNNFLMVGGPTVSSQVTNVNPNGTNNSNYSLIAKNSTSSINTSNATASINTNKPNALLDSRDVLTLTDNSVWQDKTKLDPQGPLLPVVPNLSTTNQVNFQDNSLREPQFQFQSQFQSQSQSALFQDQSKEKLIEQSISKFTDQQIDSIGANQTFQSLYQTANSTEKESGLGITTLNGSEYSNITLGQNQTFQLDSKSLRVQNSTIQASLIANIDLEQSSISPSISNSNSSSSSSSSSTPRSGSSNAENLDIQKTVQSRISIAVITVLAVLSGISLIVLVFCIIKKCKKYKLSSQQRQGHDFSNQHNDEKGIQIPPTSEQNRF